MKRFVFLLAVTALLLGVGLLVVNAQNCVGDCIDVNSCGTDVIVFAQPPCQGVEDCHALGSLGDLILHGPIGQCWAPLPGGIVPVQQTQFLTRHFQEFDLTNNVFECEFKAYHFCP